MQMGKQIIIFFYILLIRRKKMENFYNKKYSQI